jgi:hypothetical protein
MYLMVTSGRVLDQATGAAPTAPVDAGRPAVAVVARATRFDDAVASVRQWNEALQGKHRMPTAEAAA